MTTTKPGAPEYWSPERTDEHARKIAQITNQLQKGQGNNSYKPTLLAGTTQTEILVSFVRSNHIALLSPMDAGSAATMTSIWAVTENGKVTIHHGASVDDRVLGVALFG